MDIDVANKGYTKVQDTVHDSKVLDGLAKLGITLPTSFRAGKGYVDLAGVTSGQNVAVKDKETGQPIKFAEGEQFLALRVGTLGTPFATALSVTAGLATTQGGAIVEPLAVALSVAHLGASLAPTARGGVVAASPQHLVAKIEATGITSGEIDVAFLTI